MGVDRSIYVGPFLVCKMKTVQVVEQLRVCTNNKKHDVDDHDKFCSQCGGKVEEIDVTQQQLQSFASFHYTDVDDLTDDQVLVLEKFQLLGEEYIGYDGANDTEIVVYENAGLFEADHEQVHFCSQEQMAQFAMSPSQEDIELLLRTVGYEHVKVKFGVVVHVA